MQLVYERCAGLDVHKKTVVACLLVAEPNGPLRKERQTFSTMTAELLRLRDWLKAQGCTHVAMESTGVFWKPIFNVLEGHVEVLVVNAHHIKAVPGRKTDVKDAEWIAELLQLGLLRPSFIPPAWQRALRNLTRSRASLTRGALSDDCSLAQGAGGCQHQIGRGGQRVSWASPPNRCCRACWQGRLIQPR